MLKLRNWTVFIKKNLCFILEFWIKFQITDQLIFLIFYKVNYNKAPEATRIACHESTAMDMMSGQEDGGGGGCAHLIEPSPGLTFLGSLNGQPGHCN